MLQEDAAYDLLGDRRAALREDRPARLVVPPSARRQPCGPGPDPHLADHAWDAEVVHAVVREETLVFRGQNRPTDNGRDVGILGDGAVLAGELDERLPVDVVDVTDRGEFEPHERSGIRQVLAIEIDVVQGADRHQRHAGQDRAG
jgi:hypothetical protein